MKDFVSAGYLLPVICKDNDLHILGFLADNDIILIPYNPGRHWVLAALHMKPATCYYLDSLRSSIVNPQLKQTIDAAMVLYATQSGSNKRVKLSWVNARCPCQPGSTECG
ncbi:hypothetical protein L1987_65120 [Smallanthus sonchifolius]|uniref:Uncharacterized protein n=1 Tax=Smallanthus sonchifolius TaxID=185202 RepID=A0ACB9BTT4_9ASTR|nr:hypothetical protein L1987_65120 [Smallanthus sonchifolius]